MPPGIYQRRPRTAQVIADLLDQRSMPEPNSGCQLWLGAERASDYGAITYQGKRQAAHRVSWEIANGRAVPPGLFVCHKCDVRICINPDHLFLGTHDDNMADMARKGRCPSPRGEKHPWAKLTDAQRLAIISDERKQIEIARAYGIVPSFVSMLKSGARKVVQ